MRLHPSLSLARNRSPRPGRHGLLAVPLLLIVVVALVDTRVPAEVHLGPLLVAAPALTAAIGGPFHVLGVGVLAAAAQLAIGFTRAGGLTLNYQVQLLALVLVTLLILGVCSLRRRDQRTLTQVRSVSEATQRVVLRPLPKRLGALEIASVYLAAESEARIGGDLYAAAHTAQGTRLLIGDVRGKGMEAISDAAVLLGAFREAVHEFGELSALADRLERSVSRDLLQFAETGRTEEDFITTALVEVPEHSTALRLVNCGHPPPLRVSGPHVTSLHTEHPAPPLGLGELASVPYAVATFGLEAGETLLLYTDGVIEARDETGSFYPLQDRLGRFDSSDPATFLQELRADLLDHAGGSLDDDAAFLAVRRTSSAY